MPKGVFSLLQTKTLPGRCRVHLVHAEEDLLCDWQPSQFERHVIAHRLDYTVVCGSDKWMGASKHQYLHWLRCQLPLGRHELAHLKLRHPEVIPVRDGMAAPLSGSALKPSWIDTSGAQQSRFSCLPSTSPTMHFWRCSISVYQIKESHQWKRPKRFSYATSE